MSNVTLEPLDKDNWYDVCQLSVSEEQKTIFPVPNVYWIGISRYGEMSELFAVKLDNTYAGLIGGGLYEDGVSGVINPLMIDHRYQRRGAAAEAVRLMIDYLAKKYNAPQIILGHRKTNTAAANFYEKQGFIVKEETEKEIVRSYLCKVLKPPILSLCSYPERQQECVDLLVTFLKNREAMEKQTSACLNTDDILPQGYFMLKDDKVIGWVGLMRKEVIVRDDLSPWISPLLVAESERGRQYGRALLEHARKEAGSLGFESVYLTTDHIGYYEKYGFREIGLSTFTWGRPTKIYEHTAITQGRNGEKDD